MGGVGDRYGRQKCVHGFGGKTCGKEPLGKPRRRWEDNTKVDLQEVGWGLGLD